MKARRRKKSTAKAKVAVKAKKVVTTPSSSAENQLVKKLQKEVAIAISAYMDKQKIGFNEFARRLGTSATQMQKIQKGAANLTFASLAHIAVVMKKKVRLMWG